jgi:AcrR family transcriptional regulator
MPPRADRTARTPQQTRSRATVEAILEASARILERDGARALTTARIAREAGVGVGSLYEYFDGKNAVVRALCERHMADVRAVIDGALARLGDATIADGVDAYIDGLYAMHAARPAFRRAILRELPERLGSAAIAEVDRYIEVRTAAWLKTRQAQLRSTEVEALSFVLVRAGRAVTTESVAAGQSLEELARTRRLLKDMILRTLLP